MRKEKILVIGGTGFIGFHIMKALLKLDYRIVSVSLHEAKKIRVLNKVNYITMDISKIKNFKKLDNHNFKFVINLGGYVDHINKSKVEKFHFFGVKNLFYYFEKKKIETFYSSWEFIGIWKSQTTA